MPGGFFNFQLPPGWGIVDSQLLCEHTTVAAKKQNTPDAAYIGGVLLSVGVGVI